jgi:phosphoglycolate phosphatase-like HAD superfamily hydrolase
VEKVVKNVPPFPGVRESLQKLQTVADCVVVSATPNEALEREWREHDVDQYVAVIAGQERGKKIEHIALAAGGKYPTENILMIGDAPGDMKAARANNALFFPINPGHEEDSWAKFHDEALDRFVASTYAGDYEASLIAEFDKLLPEHPSWE